MFKAICTLDAFSVVSEVPGLPKADVAVVDQKRGFVTLVWEGEGDRQRVTTALHRAAANQEFLRQLAVRFANPSLSIEDRMRSWARWLRDGIVNGTVN